MFFFHFREKKKEKKTFRDVVEKFMAVFFMDI